LSNCPFLLWPPCFLQLAARLAFSVDFKAMCHPHAYQVLRVQYRHWFAVVVHSLSLLQVADTDMSLMPRGADSNTEHRRHRAERRNPQQLSCATSVQPLTQVRARHTAAATHIACTLFCLDWLFLPYFALLCFAMLCVALLCSSCLIFCYPVV